MLEAPVTRDKARAFAVDNASDSSTVIEVLHPGFNEDEFSGGYAFVTDRGFVMVSRRGNYSIGMDPGGDHRRAVIGEYWVREQHFNRLLDPSELSVWHRAALVAIRNSARTVAEIDPIDRLGVDQPGDIAKADYILVKLRRRVQGADEKAALRVLAADDALLEPPGDWQVAHPCPICGLPAIGGLRHPREVCDQCFGTAKCSEGRLVSGYNTSPEGGFEASHDDDESLCPEVTQTGRCWIDGQQCEMGEARFGGVYIEAASGSRG